MDYHVSLKLVLKNKLGEVLLLKEPDDNSMAGYYDLPGGRVTRGEINTSLRKIIKREIAEEIGSQVKYLLKEIPVATGRHVYYSKRSHRDQHLFWIVFETKYLGGKINVSFEHKEYAWIKITKRNYQKYFIRGPLDSMHNYLFHKFA